METGINSSCRKRNERERERRSQTHAKLVAAKPRQKYSEIVSLFYGSCLSPALQCLEINCFRFSVKLPIIFENRQECWKLSGLQMFEIGAGIFVIALLL